MASSPKSITWTWDTIKGFGQAKALKSSYIFLFLVPILARVLINIPDSITIPFWDKALNIPLELPFSWVVLFVSACMASLGNIIYAIMCPKLVKEFSDYPQFREAERDGTYLRFTIQELALQRSQATIEEQIESVKQLYNPVPIDIARFGNSLNGSASLLANEFYFVRDSANLGNPLARLVASISYFGAFICLGVIAIQNIIYVVQYFMPITMTT